jgi:hypothetical protein
MKSLLGQKDDGNGDGRFAKAIIRAELSANAPDPDVDEDVFDTLFESCVLEESIREFDQMRTVRIGELQSELGMLQDNPYLRMLRAEKAELEHEYFQNM